MLNKPVVYLDHIYGFFLREKKSHCKYKNLKSKYPCFTISSVEKFPKCPECYSISKKRSNLFILHLVGFNCCPHTHTILLLTLSVVGMTA